MLMDNSFSSTDGDLKTVIFISTSLNLVFVTVRS